MSRSKLAKIKTLKYLVFSRWFLHLGILLLGLIQKVLGVAKFDPRVFVLLAITYAYNLGYYLYLKKPAEKITKKGIYIVSLLQVILDQIFYSVIIYFTGGVESLSFLFYFLAILMAVILFSEIEIILLTLLSGIFYIIVIVLEYHQILPHHFRYAIDPGFYQNSAITVHNTATVALTIIFTAFLAAFIGRVIRSREEALMAETNKVNITLNNLIDGVIVFDPKGKIILINPQAADILKVEETKKVLNKKINTELFADNLADLITYIIELFVRKANNAKEIKINEKGIGEVYLKVHGITLFNETGELKGFLTIIRNITREKELDRLKSDFISIAAHQLRTPLSTIKWLFKMLLEGDAGELSPKQQDLISKGFERNDEVIEIVNNLLDVSEIEEGKLFSKRVEYSIDKILDDIYKSSKDNAEHREIELIYKKSASPLPKIKVDHQKMKISLQNLIDNAIKYTKAKGKVILSTDCKKDHLLIKVADNGIGIPKEEQDKIFSKFFRSRNAVSQSTTGSGLGLYIVKNIIRNHNGEIWFESIEGKGTVFYVKLPLN